MVNVSNKSTINEDKKKTFRIKLKKLYTRWLTINGIGWNEIYKLIQLLQCQQSILNPRVPLAGLYNIVFQERPNAIDSKQMTISYLWVKGKHPYVNMYTRRPSVDESISSATKGGESCFLSCGETAKVATSRHKWSQVQDRIGMDVAAVRCSSNLSKKEHASLYANLLDTPSDISS